MVKEIAVASTTDEMEDVQAAADASAEELASGRLPERPETEPKTETVPEREAEVEEQRPSGTKLQKRFDKLTRQKYEDRERIQQLEARLREIEESTSRPKEARVEEPPKPTEKPVESPTADETTRGAEELKRQAEAFERGAQEVKARFVRDYEVALPKGSPERAELDEAAERTTAEVGGIHPTVAHVVMAMPNSIDVYAHLATHPDDLRVLNASRSLAEATNVRYIAGVLRGVVQGRSAQPRPRPNVNRPPEPARPVRGGSSASSASLEDADYQTYKRVREQQEKNRYR